jgi:hypothetical protein
LLFDTSPSSSYTVPVTIVRWADQFVHERVWAVEDCRHLSRRLGRDMLAAGERIVRCLPS